SLYKVADQVMVDTEHAIEESGDIATPAEEGWIDRGSIMTRSEQISKKSARVAEAGKTVVLKTTGMALFDVVVAHLRYQQAKVEAGGADGTMYMRFRQRRKEGCHDAQVQTIRSG